MKISQILDKIDENQLFVPEFQREYVWKKKNAKELVDSLIKEYPTGTLLTWETSDPPELKGPWKYGSKQGAVKLVLDGQQRITTLYLLIRGEIPPYYNEGEILADPRKLHINVETGELQYYKKQLMEKNPVWCHLTDVFQRKIRAREIIREVSKGREVSDAWEDRVDDNFRKVERILDHDFPEQTIPIRADIREAIDIFYIVNAGGVNLTEAELALAQICGYWPEARRLIKKKLQELKEFGFVFTLDFMIYVLLGALYHMGSDMSKLHNKSNKDRIIAAWKQLSDQTLDYVVNLLRTHAYIDHTAEINSIYGLVPIIVYAYEKGAAGLSEDEIKRTVKWFYYAQVRQRYSGQLQTKLDRDLGIVQRSESPFDELLNGIAAERSLEIKPEEFVGTDVRHPLFSLMRWYFKSRNAVCFTTGVGLRQNMGSRYALEKDHIFAYSRLKEAGYGQDNRLKYALAQEITNRAFLTQIANRTKSNLKAVDYLADVAARLPNALKLQSIPDDPILWDIEEYEHFLEHRRKLLAGELNEFLQRITETSDDESSVSIEELIKVGESDELEFKSSLRWDYRQDAVNKALEGVILKTIAAFGNADGGTLLIGIDDDGEILGLEHDYSTLGGGKDEFELHLTNLSIKSFGKVYSKVNLSVSFLEVGDNDLCRIDIKRNTKPIYLALADKHGGRQKKFFVRSGNSSQELGISEVNEYIAQHF